MSDEATVRASDTHVTGVEALAAPVAMKRALPATERQLATVVDARRAVESILDGDDARLLMVVGPCSIHDPVAAHEYAERLKRVADRVSDRILVVMRVYFEKPRTRLGWRGLILDPHLDGTNHIDEGLRRAREILLHVTDIGLPAGSEVLDPIIINYIDDLVSWASIGARTIESQTHREMASGLSMPVGFKNGTDGSIENAANAMASSRSAHSFLGIDQEGRTSIVRTSGNRGVHIILRGGRDGPNYYPWDVVRVEELLRHAGVPPVVVVDCSHANSGKDHTQQAAVFRSVLEQRAAGRSSIRGVMVESNLLPGRQDPAARPLRYGVSITDACIGWDETEELIGWAYEQEGKRNAT